MRKKRWATVQPRHGDAVIHCGHEKRPFHVWGTDTDFERPDGSKGHAVWFMCCNECLLAAGGDHREVDVRGDGTWKGDLPSVEAPS